MLTYIATPIVTKYVKDKSQEKMTYYLDGVKARERLYMFSVFIAISVSVVLMFSSGNQLSD